MEQSTTAHDSGSRENLDVSTIWSNRQIEAAQSITIYPACDTKADRLTVSRLFLGRNVRLGLTKLALELAGDDGTKVAPPSTSKSDGSGSRQRMVLEKFITSRSVEEGRLST